MTAKKSDASSAPARRRRGSARLTRASPARQLSRKQRAEIEALDQLPDDRIDTSDAPELADWTGSKRGRFYRPVKQQLTFRVDADVLDWFKRHPRGRGYQTHMNEALRAYVEEKESVKE